jgi:hypothetical protein
MPKYIARKDRYGTPTVYTLHGAVHSIHDDIDKAEKASDVLNNGGEQEYQKMEWDND